MNIHRDNLGRMLLYGKEEQFKDETTTTTTTRTMILNVRRNVDGIPSHLGLGFFSESTLFLTFENNLIGLM